ncbi:MAG: prolyl oligopeptidase family serine peptidase [Acidobacteria bacterium]|nr:prolyl oligopeptidase family serine peptidase [Acidobacteriota bacterium]
MYRVPGATALPLLAVFLIATAGHPQESSLTNHPLASDLVPGEPRFDLLLPPAYEPERTEPYPLLLWLHGGSSGEGNLERRLRPHLERAWKEGTIEHIVVVAPITGGSYVAQDRAGTVLGGGSAGGQGTLRIGLRNPEMFAAAAALEPGFPPVASFADLDLTPYGPGAMRFLQERFGNPFDVEYWRARHPPTIVIDNADRLRASGLKLLVEAGDEDANLTYLSAELLHRLLFDAAIPHEYHLVQGAAHTGRSVPRRITNVLAFFQRALRPQGPDPQAEDHLARAKQSGRYAPRVPNQLDFNTVDFRSPPP